MVSPSVALALNNDDGWNIIPKGERPPIDLPQPVDPPKLEPPKPPSKPVDPVDPPSNPEPPIKPIDPEPTDPEPPTKPVDPVEPPSSPEPPSNPKPEPSNPSSDSQKDLKDSPILAQGPESNDGESSESTVSEKPKTEDGGKLPKTASKQPIFIMGGALAAALGMIIMVLGFRRKAS